MTTVGGEPVVEVNAVSVFVLNDRVSVRHVTLGVVVGAVDLQIGYARCGLTGYLFLVARKTAGVIVRE